MFFLPWERNERPTCCFILLQIGFVPCVYCYTQSGAFTTRFHPYHHSWWRLFSVTLSRDLRLPESAPGILFIRSPDFPHEYYSRDCLTSLIQNRLIHHITIMIAPKLRAVHGYCWSDKYIISNKKVKKKPSQKVGYSQRRAR